MDDGRIYHLEKGAITLRSKAIKDLQRLNQNYPGVLSDSKFIKKLAVAVFGADCLKDSSVYGKQARNTFIQHQPLDEYKLNFTRGMVFIHVKVYKHAYSHSY